MATPVQQSRRSVAAWLIACCVLVFVMVVVGGITRLTHSGLSMVEWQPIMGAIPPLNDAQWEEAFAKYRETPEFRQVNFSITLDGFKRIFWWEYIHRLLARLIGVVFLLPYLYFLVRKKLDRPLAWKLGGIFLLGALQGTLGFLDRGLARQLEEIFERDRADCIELDARQWKKRGLLHRAKDNALYLFNEVL